MADDSDQENVDPVFGSEDPEPVFGGADETAGSDFQPLFKAPEVEVKTFEEDEIVVFKMRVKLFKFIKEDIYGGETRKNYWKERGTGDVKLLRHREFGKIRLLMRQEQTLKVCANHLVSPHVELSPNVGSDRSWVFTAADFADEEVKTETFAIKFGNAEKAKKFKDSIELAKKINAGEADPEEAKEVNEDDEEVLLKEGEAPSTKKTDNDADKLAEGISNVKVDDSAKEKKTGMFKESSAADDTDVQDAASFAVKQLNSTLNEKDNLFLHSIKKAEIQVVAGKNFKLVVSCKTKTEIEEPVLYEVVVHKMLPHLGGTFSLLKHKHIDI